MSNNLLKPFRTATWGRCVGERGWVCVWSCRIPGTEEIRPHLSVCTLRDDDGESELSEEFISGIWPMAPEGWDVAERIARDLLARGWAVVWPHECGLVRVYVGSMHHLHIIGGQGE